MNIFEYYIIYYFSSIIYMSKLYLKTLICIIIVLWLYYFILLFSRINTKIEPFNPELNSIYNRHKRIFYKNLDTLKEHANLIMNTNYFK